jgi:two-component system, sensor histidine kinase LadS
MASFHASFSPLIRHLLCGCLIIIAVAAQTVLAQAVSVVTLDENTGEILPSGVMTVVEDVSASWALEDAIDALQSEGDGWNGPGFPVFGLTSSAYWAAMSIDNTFTTDQQWLAKMRFASIDRIDIYYQAADGTWVHKAAGDTLPLANRDVDHHSILFAVPIFAGKSQTLYFRVESTGSLQMPISLISMQEFQLQSKNEFFWAGLYYGVIMVIAMCSAFIWVSTKDRSYLYYVLYLLAGGLYAFSFQGFSYQYLWPDNPFWAHRSILVLSGLSCAAGLMFVRHFIEIARVNQALDILMQRMVFVALGFSVMGLMLPYFLLTRVLILMTLTVMVLVSYASWKSFKRRSRSAGYFMAAWSFLLIGIFLEIVQRLGANLPPLLSFSSMQYGTIASVLLLSFGLGDRINSLIKQYSAVQSDILKANQLKIEALQKADDVKEEFIANVSHELRTPLTGIIGLSEIILENRSGALEESVRENLNLIKISGQRLANLVNDVIDFSAIKNGHLELTKRAVDLKSICILVNRMCRPLIGDKYIQLDESYPDEPVLVLGDEDRLQQILFNLVSNAIKFTQRGWVAVSIEIIDIDARVMVKDTGIGISKDHQSRIFNRFYQIDSAASREEGGTGLGLTISQKLVELHGTEIILRSSPGEGSTFYFDLPLLGDKDKVELGKNKAQKKLASESTERLSGRVQSAPPVLDRRSRRTDTYTGDEYPQAMPGRRRKILIVDDEYLNVRIVQEHLSGLYDMVSALNGHDALEMLASEHPDIVVLDLMMPIMTGFDLCQRIRERYSMDELPIVILTAKNRVEDLVQGLNLGANDYISKPFSKEELKVRIGKQFEMLNLLGIRHENQRLNWQLQKYQESEKKLRDREMRLAKTLDVTGDALVSLDESGIVVYVNKQAEQLLDIGAAQFQDEPLSQLIDAMSERCADVGEILSFPFSETVISSAETPTYFRMTLEHPAKDGAATWQEQIRVCVLPLSLDQEFYLLMFQRVDAAGAAIEDEASAQGTVPGLIGQINRNVQRTQELTQYLARITPEDLQKHRHLFNDLESVDRIIQSLSGALPSEAEDEQHYREALVKLMQDCHYYWQKVTGESIIELAEKSRIWSISIDNGRLRTRSMNRYLSIDKLPSNPRWRQVARTAYFVLSKVAHDAEAKSALEKSVTRLQDIVESRALA